MKKKLTKQIKKKINDIFLIISKNKIYLWLNKKHIVFRIFIAIFFILFGIIAVIFPMIPGGILLIAGLILIFKIKYVKSKLLYFLSITRIKYFFILIYIKIKILKTTYFKKK